ncbi:hypothetical protein HDC34_002772 [Pseudoclavibacter sp. JAI123]|nr:hypothetical protein [Pseudoclavibacter sp. JAI123]
MPATSVVNYVDANSAAVGKRGHDGAQRLGGAAGATDDAAEVLGVHTHFEDLAARSRAAVHADIVGVIDDSLDEMFQRGSEHD